jgi:hypothetical protein
MRWYLGYPVLAAGLAFGMHTLFPTNFDDLRPSASALLTLETAHAATVITAEASDEEFRSSRLARFSPGLRLADGPEFRGSVIDYLASRLATLDVETLAPSASRAAPAAAAQDVTLAPWRSAVTEEARLTEASTGSTDGTRREMPRETLARAIQRELRHAGCYVGEIDGVWGVGSQRAMLMFMDRVNATLPTGEPDVFMLSLIRTQSTITCGRGCPLGQSLTSSGRCLPNAILAHAGKKSPAGERLEVATHQTPTSLPVAARAEAEKLAWAPQAGNRDPFPGRMSIGGPKTLDDTASAAPVTAPAPQRTAALNATDVASAELAVAAPAAVVPAAPIVKPRVKATSSKSSRSQGARLSSNGTYRHVQRLFEHPLGRL